MVAHNAAASKLSQEVGRTVEVGHLHIRRADGIGDVRIAASAGCQIELGRELRRLLVEAAQRRLRVEDLDRVDQARRGQRAQCRLGKIAAHGVEWVRHVHEATLHADDVRGSHGRRAERDALGEEQPDDLAGMRAQLLADHHTTRQLGRQLDCAANGVVIGDAQHVDPALHHGGGDLVGRGGGVTAPHGVTVQVDAHPTLRHWFGEMRVALDRSGQRGGHSAPRYRRTLRRMRLRIRNKPLMVVTGASGFLGRHLLRAAEKAEWQLFMPPSSALDVRERERVIEQITGWKPAAIVHLAYRRDDRRIIVQGSANVAEAAAACGARLIHLSTDVVFAGRALPYRELDLPDASINYGVLKAQAEREVAAIHPHALLVRTSLLYGTDHLAMCQLDVEQAANGSHAMTFFTDELRCPAHAADVADALVVLVSRPEITGPLHLAGPQPVSRAAFAATIATWMGYDPSLLSTSTLGAAAVTRPANVVLDTSLAASMGLRCKPVEQWLRRRSW